MPTVTDVLEHAKFLIGKGRGDEPAVLYLPKIEAQKRKANREKRKRIVWDTTPEMYSAWNVERDRYICACVNKQVALEVMLMILKAVPESTIQSLMEAGSAQDSTVAGEILEKDTEN